jgi:hypothetical protein
MFKYISQFFTPKENQKKSEDISNALTILLDNNKEPYIHIAIADTSSQQSENFANMLYQLNKGSYVSYMANILILLSEKNPEMKVFVTDVMHHWSFLLNSGKQDEPLIKPTNFIKGMNHEQ